jgi:hypothetical protein
MSRCWRYCKRVIDVVIASDIIDGKPLDVNKKKKSKNAAQRTEMKLELEKPPINNLPTLSLE